MPQIFIVLRAIYICLLICEILICNVSIPEKSLFKIQKFAFHPLIRRIILWRL